MRTLTITLSTAFFLAATQVAAETVTLKDGRFQADVSARQMSMISLVGEKVSTIRKLDEAKGPSMMMEADGATGEVFVGFDGDVVGGSFSAFLVTSSGKTIQAVLTPRDIPAESVIVRPDPADAVTGPTQKGAGGASAEGAPGSQARRDSYTGVLTALVRVMFNDEAVLSVVRTPLMESPKRAGPFELQGIATFSVAGLKGTVISLRNLSPVGQPLNAKTFLVPGVLAAAVSHETIDPQQYGRVYIVEETP